MKNLFLLDPSIVFLNHGSFGACPAKVLESYQGWQRELERNPVELLGRRSADLLAQSRTVLGRCVGANPDDLVFVTNATCGVNTVPISGAPMTGETHSRSPNWAASPTHGPEFQEPCAVT